MVTSISSGATSASIQVVVRLRPMNEQEQTEGTLPVISASTSSKCVTVIKGVGQKQARSQFQFDNVFGTFSTQREVFGATLKPVIRDVLKGYETCVFAYGQTGTGKTHTMEGRLDDPEEFGVIPRSAQAIFEAIDKPQYTESRVTCSYLEIYNEDLSDLLASDRAQKLDIMNNGKGVTCRGLSEASVDSAEDVLHLMQSAVQARRVGETRMNKQSSRSHCIFTIRVAITETLPNGSIMEYQGKLHCVDLAGSESAKTAEMKDSSAEVQAVREQERRNINKSLLTLGRVITALKEQSDGKKNPIPYRDSKLTRILQEALGGRCKTVVVATISPSIMNLQETMQTLHYAQKANGIKNKPVSSSYMSVSGICSTPSKADRNAMPAERWHEMEIRMEHMQQEVEEARHALARNYMQHQELVDRAEKAETDFQALTDQVEVIKVDMEKAKKDLDLEKEEKRKVEKELSDTRISLSQTITILKATQDTEVKLTGEALSLMQNLKSSVADGDMMHGMLKALNDEDIRRKTSTRDYCGVMASALNVALERLDDIREGETANQGSVKSQAGSFHDQQSAAIEDARNLLAKVLEHMGSMSSETQVLMRDTMQNRLGELQTSTESLTTQISAVVLDGEEQLHKSCDAARKQLAEFDQEIANLHGKQTAQHQDASVKLAASSNSLKSKVENVIDDTSSLLRQAANQNEQAQTVLAQLLKEWHASGAASSAELMQVSTDQLSLLDSKRRVLSDGFSHHELLGSELKKHQTALNVTQSKQLDTLSSQNETLVGQNKMILQSQEMHDSLCKSVMDTIMSGVNKLVTDQMSMVMQQNSSQSKNLLENLQQADSTNVELQGITKQAFEELLAQNQASQTEASSIHDIDRDVLHGLDQSKDACKKLQGTTEALQAKNDTFSASTSAEMKSLAQVNERFGKITADLSSEGKAGITEIAETTRNEAQGSLDVVNEAGTTMASFARDEVTDKFTMSLKAIEEPRAAVLESFSKNVGTVKQLNAEASEQLQSVADDQIQLVSRTSDSIGKEGDAFQETALSHLKNAEALRDNMVSASDAHMKAFAENVSLCGEEVGASNVETSKFANDVIQMDVETVPVAERLAVKYSEKLTATPKEEILLKGAVMKLGLETQQHSMTVGPAASATTPNGLSRSPFQEKQNIPVSKNAVRTKRRPGGDKTSRLQKRSKTW